MAVVCFRHAEKSYPGGSRVISDFNLEITDGELLVLVGPSGCGKSTVLRMVAGLEEVSGGEILIDGQVVNDWPPQRRNIAMVFQNYALYPHMSVRRNLEFPLRMQKLAAAEIRQRVERAAALDFYASLRSSYTQRREALVRDEIAAGSGTYDAYTGREKRQR